MTAETVATETPAASATSIMVGAVDLRGLLRVTVCHFRNVLIQTSTNSYVNFAEYATIAADFRSKAAALPLDIFETFRLAFETS